MGRESRLKKAEKERIAAIIQGTDEEMETALTGALNELAKTLRRIAQEFPYRDFSRDPDERHCMVLGWSDWPAPVSILFTLDKDSLRGTGQSDQWHLSIIFEDNEEDRVPDEIALRIAQAFFPDGQARETFLENGHPSRHWWADVSPAH